LYCIFYFQLSKYVAFKKHVNQPSNCNQKIPFFGQSARQVNSEYEGSKIFIVHGCVVSKYASINAMAACAFIALP
jgi:hypothetical protein